MTFSKDGQIDVFSIQTLKSASSGSVFNIKSEDYLGMLLIKSKDYVIFTLERQKMEFISV
jgi:hypothetical protein